MRVVPFTAARLNMSFALLLVISAMMAIKELFQISLHPGVYIIITVLALLNVSTVWLTDLYFTGRILDTGWGSYVEADSRFIITPLLLISLAAFSLILLIRQYRCSPPLDKNRVYYILLSFLFLTLSFLDFLPHFGIVIFSSPIGSVSLIAFLLVFSYASMHVRLTRFLEFTGLLFTWSMILVLTWLTYRGISHLFNSLDIANNELGSLGRLIPVLACFYLGQRYIPSYVRGLILQRPDYSGIIALYSNRVRNLSSSSELIEYTREMLFDNRLAGWMDLVEAIPSDIKSDIQQLTEEGRIIDYEEFSSRREIIPSGLEEAELIVPVSPGSELKGLLLLGRIDGKRRLDSAYRSAVEKMGGIFSFTLLSLLNRNELERRHDLDRYLPPQIVEGILNEGLEGIDRKRRIPITVFFTDIVGFTELSDTADPTIFSEILNDYLSAMSDLVFKYEGTLDKFIGDSVMVFFGAPLETNPKDQVRHCMQMAFAMSRALKELNIAWRERGFLNHDLEVRSGMHYGEANIGSFGNRHRMEYTAIG
ncbi:MAG: adenylate/guanylate cyclase domain-containing protein, partial [Spirochaetales bacterium]|nr:adenylate/guanylate cyclase domain-containing protein [Spirochaetales bacterium]